ncbi:MAG: hypothetical protein WD871_01630 [Xanthobacteraceae bacterium]
MKIIDMLDDDWRPGGNAEALVDQIAVRLAVTAPVAVERAASLWAWKRVYESKHGKDRGGDRKSAEFKAKDQNEKFSFCSVAAQRLGLTERAIQLDVQLAEDLGPADMRRLWDTCIADNGAALRTFAALASDVRAKVVARFKRQPHASWNDHLLYLDLKAERDSEEAAYRRLADLWASSSARVRRRFLLGIGVPDKSIAGVMQRLKSRAAA